MKRKIMIAWFILFFMFDISLSEDLPVIEWSEHGPAEQSLSPEETHTFGEYEQDSNSNNGEDLIEWINDEITEPPVMQEDKISNSTNPVSAPWPIIKINRKAVEKTGAWDDTRVFGYFGPGKEFLSVAYFRWSHINDPYSLFTLGEYTLIDFNYPTRGDWHGRISAFIKTTSLRNRSDLSEIEELEFETIPATLLQKTTPRFGPGEEYALISDDMYIISSSVDIESGGSVSVLFEANDWAYIEFTCQKKEDKKTLTGTARGWIPIACVYYPQ